MLKTFFSATHKCVYRSLNYLIIRAEVVIQCITVVSQRIALSATPYFVINVALSQAMRILVTTILSVSY